MQDTGTDGLSEGKRGPCFILPEEAPSWQSFKVFPLKLAKFIFAYIRQIFLGHPNWERSRATWEPLGDRSCQFFWISAISCPGGAPFLLRNRKLILFWTFSSFLISEYHRPHSPEKDALASGLPEREGCLEYDLPPLHSPS